MILHSSSMTHHLYMWCAAPVHASCFMVKKLLDFFIYSDALNKSSQKTNSSCIFKILNSLILSVFASLWTNVWSVKKQVWLLFVRRVWCKQGGGGAPNDCFPYNICSELRRSKYCLEFSITWERLNVFGWTSHAFMDSFRSLAHKFPRVFWSLLFHISLVK